jgi:hypothetical protein
MARRGAYGALNMTAGANPQLMFSAYLTLKRE